MGEIFRLEVKLSDFVMPAQAGIHDLTGALPLCNDWIPASAGKTDFHCDSFEPLDLDPRAVQ